MNRGNPVLDNGEIGIPIEDLCAEGGHHIFQLSDEVLLMIIKYLPTQGLISISRSCERFRRLCFEKKFWIKIEDPPDDYETVCEIFNTYFTPLTCELRLSSNSHGCNPAYRSSFCPSHLDSLNTIPSSSETVQQPFVNLTQVSLIRQRLNGRHFTLNLFPKHLRVLNLSGTHISNVVEEDAYFKGISSMLESLEEINLDECKWVTSHALLPISKCPSLYRLSLRGCRDIGNCVAYIALASRFGFKALKVLDVTNTTVGSSDLSGFAAIPNLEEFYFGQYDLPSDPNDHHAINDQSLAVIAYSSKLKVLDFSGSMVTDRSIETLLTIPNLSRVTVHFTLLTPAGINRLRNQLPQCTVHKCIEFLPPDPT